MKLKLTKDARLALTNSKILANMGLVFYLVGTFGAYENSAIDTKEFLIKTGITLMLILLG